MALTAASASADIVDPVTGDPYVGPIGLAGDMTFGTISCQGATASGTMDGNAPATGELSFSWSNCGMGGPSCTVAAVDDVSVDFDESPTAPDFLIVNAERLETSMSCTTAFNCTVSSDPANGSELEAFVAGGADPVVTIDDTLPVSGVGCPSQIPVEAEYEIVVPEDGLESND